MREQAFRRDDAPHDHAQKRELEKIAATAGKRAAQPKKKSARKKIMG
jgi:hypothetical protein